MSMRQACDWNRPVTLLQADARKLPLADESVQCIVTSPPYWGLRKYAGEQETDWLDGSRSAYGLEPTIEMYLDHTREILRELWRVLRRDGVLFWNIGDSYSSFRDSRTVADTLRSSDATAVADGANNRNPASLRASGLKHKDLCLIPERVALAAQADGWWVRSRILWCKPNPMPESVTDRPTDAAEHIWMLTKSERYYWDADAVREPATGNTHDRGDGDGGPKASTRGSYEGWMQSMRDGYKPGHDARDGKERFCSGTGGFVPPGGRNLRNVWNFPTQPYPEAHFATFPEELPRRCILAATSAKGACAQCGAPWERVTTTTTTGRVRPNGAGTDEREKTDGQTQCGWNEVETIGWTPTCRCRGQHRRTQPCVVLDPFGGSGTTGRVAIELRRRAVLCDIAYGEKDVYRALAEDRTSEVDVQLPFL